MTSSGGYGYRVQKSLARGYIKPELGEVGTELRVDILDQMFPAKVVPMPLYDPDNEKLKS